MNKIKVIYVVGTGRSGTTLYDRIFGTLDGVSSFNEIYRLWQEGFLENSRCACGEAFDACSFWTPIASRLVRDASDLDRIVRLHHAVDHSRHFLKLYYNLGGRPFREKVHDYREVLRELYFAIAENSGNDVIVDSSKVPSRALILSQIPGIEVHLVHAVRDVRALVYAWRKKKHNPATGGDLTQYPPYRTATFWMARNIFSEMLASRLPYQRVVYEEFAARPRTVMQKLVDNLPPVAGQVLPFTSEDEIDLGPLHSIGGNPHRFRIGPTQIRNDDAWKNKIDPGARRLATVLASPLLSRYGYTQSANLVAAPKAT